MFNSSNNFDIISMKTIFIKAVSFALSIGIIEGERIKGPLGFMEFLNTFIQWNFIFPLG